MKIITALACLAAINWCATACAVPQPLPGDYDGDGSVDEFDYLKWRVDFGQVGMFLASDGNHDQIVDAADYTIWRDAKEGLIGIDSAGASPSHSLPEPSAVVLAVLAGGGLLLVRRKRAATLINA